MDITEKRVYADREGKTDAFLATGAGLARVSVSADQIGEFGLERRGEVTDVAADEGRLAVAAEDVLVATDDGFAETGFGPATAVGFDGDAVLAAGDERVARYDDGWTTTAELDEVRALDGDLVATADGVVRIDGTSVGLTDARDVAAGEPPLAATGDGLYHLGNGWMRDVGGDFRGVAVDGERAGAATADALYERVDGEWREREVPLSAVADVTHAPDAVYAVSPDGTFAVDAGDGWRTRALGLPEVRALVVP